MHGKFIGSIVGRESMRWLYATCFVFGGIQTAAASQQVIDHTEKVQSVAPGADVASSAVCPSGMRVTGGGFMQSQSPERYTTASSAPTQNPDGWLVRQVNTSSAAAGAELTAYAICSSP
jgi:hypothetical protein